MHYNQVHNIQVSFPIYHGTAPPLESGTYEYRNHMNTGITSEYSKIQYTTYEKT